MFWASHAGTKQWCLSVVPAWPAQHIFISGVYLWCQHDLPKTFASVGVCLWFQDDLPNIFAWTGVYLWCQHDLPNTFPWVVSICGARMTCPTHCMNGVYLWCQHDLPNTFSSVLSICGARIASAQHICISGIYQWCQDDMPNTFASVGVYLRCQHDLPNRFASMVSICGARMTCPTLFHEWCLSVVPELPAHTFAWVVSICGARMTCPTHLHEWCLSVVSIGGVYLWCQDDLNPFLLVCQTALNSTNYSSWCCEQHSNLWGNIQ